ncbi:MAG: class I SAM-dependent methyltransferase [Rhodospirillales bacterium]|jgi:NADH dehydrogenase [ubiquinone] 1 alpha subcomplex assembly factor 7|nr:class I SAM-dependent methyltransferase [Rhodospirillales bacterium]MBT4625911.1 class I SAM-dependent methyltransferase [Rhodospirillales bacterium]MBT5352347.1 class I SAM-dependent methyltransferase [Rhodospirillales bacterium]MBT5519793.1 class I SAM-dependent methyltransferase [Rhodospirillales bacterium]MBT6111656.1 class I SAM-dependent methyltransferase [Rhodospirillales bacterium]
MTPLFGHLVGRIARDGPLTVAQFMEEALGNKDHGYYITRDPLGARGDFTTSPEISQVFGELLGLWCASVWESLGSPDTFRWVEMGPGRGTLMADAVRATRKVGDFHAAANIHLIETSPVLMDRQREALAAEGFATCGWHRDLSQIPDGPVICIANEFFDALPVRQFQRVLGGWRERLVDLNEDKNGLRFILSDQDTKPHFIPDSVRHAPDENMGQSLIETSPMGMRVMHTLSDRLIQSGGAALIIDYGHAVTAVGETLQAVQDHKFTDVLDNPGEQDLTAHVDFGALRLVAQDAGATCSPVMEQGTFLNALGVSVRAKQLADAASSFEQGQDVAARIDRLVNPDQMGQLFKVMGVSPSELAPLPGLG